MKWNKLLPLALAIVALGPVARAQDANDPAQIQLWRDFYKYAADIFLFRNTKGAPKAVTENLIFSMEHPALYLGEASMNQEYIDNLTNRAMRDDPMVYYLDDQPISKTWKRILEQKQFIEIQTPDPDAPSPEEIKRAEDLLKDQKYKDYCDSEALYVQAIADLKVAAKEGGNIYQINKNIEKIKREWPYRTEIETAIQTKEKARGGTLSSYWEMLKDDASNFATGSVYRCITYPQFQDWGNEKGWTTFTYKKKRTRENTSYDQREATAAAKLQIKAFKAEGDVSWKKRIDATMSSDDSLEISLSFKRVSISRPWMDWAVFDSALWWFKDRTVKISNPMMPNNPSEPVINNGLMPVVPIAYIIVKDVKFKSKKLAEFFRETSETLSSSATVKYGPFFSANTTYGYEKGSTNKGSDKEVGVITIPDPCIMGIVGARVPLSPKAQGPKK